ERHRLIPSAGPLTLFVFVESKPGPSRAWSRIQTLDALSRSARLSENRISPARGRHHDRGCPTLLAFFCERVGIGDSTARVIATLRDHHDQGCPILLASFARGWGLGIPPHDLQRRCGTITTEGAPPFSRVCERVGIGDSTARVIATLRNHHDQECPTLLASFARGWGLGIPPRDLQRRCGTTTPEGAPPFSRVCERVGIGDSTARLTATLRNHHNRGCPTLLACLREGGDWGFHRTTYSDAAEPSQPRVPHPSRVFVRGWGFDEPKDLRPPNPSPNSRI